MKRVISIFCLFCLCMGYAYAQYYSTGSDPWHRRWRQLESNDIILVYDSLVESQARYLFPLIPTDFRAVSNGRLWNRRQLSILLHSASANSNGLVAWAPRRMELYSFANIDSDCVPWLRHLATHEGRHAWQTTLVENGQTSVLNFIFGQQATGLVLGLFVPKWLLEGDAVWQETHASQGGRGRNADWLQEDMALAVAGEMPTYEQSFFGSYRNLYPDFYHMGYLLSEYGRLYYNKDNDTDLWQDILHECGRTPLSLNPFNRRLRQRTGMRQNEFYRKAMSHWHSEWTARYGMASTIDSLSLSVSHSHSAYTSYDFPQYDNNNNIIAFRTSISSIPCFVKISPDGNSETPILYTAPRNESRFHLHGDTLIWSECIPHPRWENASKNIIRWTSVSSPDKTHTISPDWYYHYLSPHISPDGSCFSAIEQLPDGHRDIIIMDFASQKVLHRISFNIPDEPQDPILLSDSTLAFILLSDSGKSIRLYNLSDKSTTTILSDRFANIHHLSEGPDNTLLYTSDESASNQIHLIYYKHNLNSDSSITSLYPRYTLAIPSQYPGHASYLNGKLLFSSYTRNGYKPAIIDFSDQLASLIPDSLRNFSTAQVDSLPSPACNLESKRFSHSISSLHSWGPVSVTPSTASMSPALSAMTQNIFSTLTTQVSLNLDPNSIERFSASLKYSALVPIFSLAYSNRKENINIAPQTIDAYINDETGDTVVWRANANATRRSNLFAIAATVPLKTVCGPWTHSLSASAHAEYRNQTGYDLSLTKYIILNRYGIPQAQTYIHNYSRISTTNLAYYLSVSSIRRSALRQIGTRYGFTATATFKHSPWGNISYGNIFAASATLFLPGIGSNHNISVTLGHQRRNTDKSNAYYKVDEETSIPNVALFGNLLNAPRGLNQVESTKYTLLRANYALPLFDPDFSLSPVLHIKRISANLFYDYARYTPYTIQSNQYTNTPSKQNLQSAGIELTSETHLLQLPYPINIGIRYSHNLTHNTNNNTYNPSNTISLLLSIAFH